MSTLTVTAAERRRLLVRRHLLDGSGTSANDVAERLVAIHATDPATPFLSVLARSRTATIADVSAAMYDERSLVRWMAMRRTVFVLDREVVPDVQASVSGPLAEVLRRRLVTVLTKNGALPVGTDVPGWVGDVEAGVRGAFSTLSAASGAELSAVEPRLRTPIPPRMPSDTRQNVTSSLLAMMSAAGEIVRAVPVGPWTTRQHRWQDVGQWWPEGIEFPDPADAAQRLAERWLRAYGPATVDDLQWWTGWSKTTTRKALQGLSLVSVDLDKVDGVDLARTSRTPREETVDSSAGPDAPTIALLPALDSTAMGWKHRHWYSPADTKGFYDNVGNIGPTIWWNGSIVGVWASTATGIRTRLLVDGGEALRLAVGSATETLEKRLHGTVVTPAIRTPMERMLRS